MPATPISPTFIPLTDPFIWFATVDAFNAFMGSISFTIESGNIPEATISARGAVSMAEAVVYADAAVVPTWVTINNDESGVTQVPSQQAYNDLKAKVDSLSQAFALLLLNLQTAGSLDS